MAVLRKCYLPDPFSLVKIRLDAQHTISGVDDEMVQDKFTY
jgi:hypothetical protein